MIHINNWGWRLGNQLFQIANAINLAVENNDVVYFPKWKYASIFEGNFSTPNESPGSNHYVYKEPGFSYNEIKYCKNISLSGYFQSEKYFIKNENTIRKIFTPKRDMVDNVVKKHEKILLSKLPLVSIHVRRGDYLKYPQHHPVVTVDYISAAAKEFGDSIFVVFSDDITWCKENINFDNFHFVEKETDVSDFILMSLCDSHIISNSTFSWWAAWLNNKNNKRVIAPKKWFGPAYSTWDIKDLYPKDWETI